jgi:hypothetical protein
VSKKRTAGSKSGEQEEGGQKRRERRGAMAMGKAGGRDERHPSMAMQREGGERQTDRQFFVRREGKGGDEGEFQIMTGGAGDWRGNGWREPTTCGVPPGHESDSVVPPLARSLSLSLAGSC